MITFTIREKTISFNIAKVTQLCILDRQAGIDIANYISKYFSSEKYTDDELSIYLNQVAEITDNQEVVARSKYESIFITGDQSINVALEQKKESLLFLYNKYIFQNVIIQSHINVIESELTKIILKIKEEYNSNLSIDIDEIPMNAELLLQKHIKSYISKSYTIFKKTEQALELLSELSKVTSKKYLLILYYPENYFNTTELREIREKSQDVENVTLLIFTANSNYVDYFKLDETYFVNAACLEQLPPFNLLLETINKKSFKEAITQNELNTFLENYSFNLIHNSYDDFNRNKEIFESLTSVKSTEEKAVIDMETCIIL